MIVKGLMALVMLTKGLVLQELGLDVSVLKPVVQEGCNYSNAP